MGNCCKKQEQDNFLLKENESQNAYKKLQKQQNSRQEDEYNSVAQDIGGQRDFKKVNQRKQSSKSQDFDSQNQHQREDPSTQKLLTTRDDQKGQKITPEHYKIFEMDDVQKNENTNEQQQEVIDQDLEEIEFFEDQNENLPKNQQQELENLNPSKELKQEQKEMYNNESLDKNEQKDNQEKANIKELDFNNKEIAKQENQILDIQQIQEIKETQETYETQEGQKIQEAQEVKDLKEEQNQVLQSEQPDENQQRKAQIFESELSQENKEEKLSIQYQINIDQLEEQHNEQQNQEVESSALNEQNEETKNEEYNQQLDSIGQQEIQIEQKMSPFKFVQENEKEQSELFLDVNVETDMQRRRSPTYEKNAVFQKQKTVSHIESSSNQTSSKFQFFRSTTIGLHGQDLSKLKEQKFQEWEVKDGQVQYQESPRQNFSQIKKMVEESLNKSGKKEQTSENIIQEGMIKHFAKPKMPRRSSTKIYESQVNFDQLGKQFLRSQNQNYLFIINSNQRLVYVQKLLTYNLNSQVICINIKIYLYLIKHTTKQLKFSIQVNSNYQASNNEEK